MSSPAAGRRLAAPPTSRTTSRTCFRTGPGGDAVITIQRHRDRRRRRLLHWRHDRPETSRCLLPPAPSRPTSRSTSPPGQRRGVRTHQRDYNVAIGSILGFDDPVTLGATGNPAGTSVGFSVNPVIPAGSSVMTIGSTGSGAPGSYTITVSGTSTTGTKTRAVGFDLFSAAPGTVSLISPANGATNQPARPTFEWPREPGRQLPHSDRHRLRLREPRGRRGRHRRDDLHAGQRPQHQHRVLVAGPRHQHLR